MMKRIATVFGATGLTGSELVKLLINDPSYCTIKIFTRKKTGFTSTKIEEHIVDLLDATSFENKFTGDVVFCCIGTTAKKTPNKELYTKIDFGIPASIAELCKKKGLPHLLCISALGADKNSSIFYNKTKGEMEETLISENLNHLHLLRPSLILGPRKELRLGEKLAEMFMIFGQLFMQGSLKKYRPIKASRIAKAMVHIAANPTAHSIVESDEIMSLSQ